MTNEINYLLARQSLSAAMTVMKELGIEPEIVKMALAVYLVMAEMTLKAPPAVGIVEQVEPIAEKCRKFLQREIGSIKAEMN